MHSKPPTPLDVRTATESFVRARSDLAARREALTALRARPVDAADQPGFFGRMWSGSQRDKGASLFFPASLSLFPPSSLLPPSSFVVRVAELIQHPLRAEAASLAQEITGLEMLARAMRDDLDRLRTARREAEWAKTLHGRVLLGAGHVFSVYCVWRVFLVSVCFSFVPSESKRG